MSGLRGSPGYIWDVKRLLGQGATSMVCPGRNKRTGEQVAVKVFNDAGNMRPTGVKNREFEVLRKLDHVNIVRMIASETEQGSSNQVIVMELCTGGSVYTMLEEPKNAFGVEEEEFLLILEHVASGMKHLREHGVVHRDIKPGNIMRFISEDGRSIYKLTDFGAARELEEEGQFMSLYGTEEYLHPDMYERAVLRGQDYKVFRATVDLWSLGVTFYHILTGQLPFRPFGGRRNRETMHKITTQKESGIISGVQNSESGPIEWSRELPQSCRASQGLQLLIVPFLASLLEADPRKTWQFDRFFIEAKKITSKKVIPMFSIPTWTLVKIYADVTDNLTKVQELVAQQAEIPAPKQLIIYQNQLLSEIVDPTQTVVTYPRCISHTKPIFIFTEDDMDSYPFPSPYINNFPRFSTTMSLDNDYPLAKMCVGILHAIHREISDCVLRQRLTHEGIVNYVNQLYHSLEHLRDNDFHLRRYCQETKKRKMDLSRSTEDKIHMLKLFSQEKPALSKLLHTLLMEWQSNRQILDEFEVRMDKLLSVINKSTGLYTFHHLERKDLLNAWDFKLGCEESMRCAPRVEMTIKSATVIMERFKIDKQKKVLPYNDEQIHKFEKNNLYMLTGKARNMLREHCIPKSQMIHLQACAWLSKASALRRESHKTEKEMEDLIALQQGFTVKLDKLCKDDKVIQSLEGLSVESAHGLGDGARWVRNGSQEQGVKPDSLVEYLVESMDSLNFDTMQVIENIKENTNSLHKRWRKEMGLVDESVPTAWGQADGSLSVFRKWTTKATSSVSRFPSTQQGVFLEVGLSHFQTTPASLSSLTIKTNLQDYEVVMPPSLNIHGQNANGLSLLHLSTFAGNVETSKSFINQGVDVDCTDKLYLTPLHWAIIKGSDEMVELLLEKNASLYVAAVGKNTAVHIAARFGRSSILKLLVRKKTDVVNLRNVAERTALHLASMHGFADSVRILLDGVADVAPVDKHGLTPLHLASACGYVEAVQLLLNTGKNNLELTCKAGFTPLLLAIQNGHKPVVDILLRYNANLDCSDGRGRGPLHLAVLHGHLDLTEYILNLDSRSVNVDAQDCNGFTSLHYAACKKDSAALKLLLSSARASVLSRNQWLQTPLHVAANSGSVTNVRLLIDHSADLEAEDQCGRSPLQVAMAMGNQSIVGLFHSSGAGPQ